MLPSTVDTEHINASYNVGMLKLELSKKPGAQCSVFSGEFRARGIRVAGLATGHSFADSKQSAHTGHGMNEPPTKLYRRSLVHLFTFSLFH
jgi:hypothetical protein